MRQKPSLPPARRKALFLLAALLLASGLATLCVSLRDWRRDADFGERAQLATGKVIGFRSGGPFRQRLPRAAYSGPDGVRHTALVELPPAATWLPDLGQTVQFFVIPEDPGRGRFLLPGPEEKHALSVGFNALPILLGGLLLAFLLGRPRWGERETRNEPGIPPGYSLRHLPDGALVIDAYRTGHPGVRAFFLILALLATAAGGISLWSFGLPEEGGRIFAACIGVLFWFILVGSSLYSYCERMSLTLSGDALSIERRLLGWRRYEVIPRDRVKSVTAHLEAEGRSTAETYVVVLSAEEQKLLASSQRRVSAHWLADRIEAWRNPV